MNVMFGKIASIFLLVLLSMLPISCNTANDDAAGDLPYQDRLGDHIALAQERTEEAAGIWDRVIFGETVSCAEYMQAPGRFEISSEEAGTYPQSQVIVEHLNNGIFWLEQVVQLWEQECNLSRDQVPVEVLREADHFLQLARDELNQAAIGWHEWQA